MPSTISSPHAEAAVDPEWLVNQIAHALRNPIFAATVQAEALALKAAGQEGLARSAEMVQGQLQRLEQDLQEMLLLGRPARIHPQPADLVPIIERAVDAFRSGFAGEAADIRLRCAVPSLVLITDESAIRIILDRLVANAVQHTPPPHTVEVEVSDPENGSAVAVVVRDSGDGIPPELLDKIFLPFYPQHRGRPGLGLAVAAKFAHALAGHIEVESEPGAGTLVRLVLPGHSPAATS